MRFILFVEGYTEKIAIKEFLKRWLDPRLKQPVGITPVRFTGWAEMLNDMAQKAHRYLDSPDGDQIIAIIALLDLYGPTIYPAQLKTASQRVNWATNNLSQKVGLERFRIFFAVHELEAWLLSEPQIFPREISQRFPRKIEQPESVNFDTPPAKLLGDMYWRQYRRQYRKIVDGSNLFGKLNPSIVYQKCPFFAEMMNEMLRLAQQAGL